jgi:integrase/recombinase XerC/integrase/recombinase XerD
MPRASAALVTGPEAAVARWVLYLASEYGASTASTYRSGILRFQRWLAGRGLSLAMVAPADVRSFRDELKSQGLAPRTVSTWLTSVRRFYAWLVEEGLPIANPATDVRGPRGGRKQHKRDELTRTEVLRLFEACGEDARDRAVFALMAYCALRTVEISRADLGDLATRDGRQILWIHGKGADSADAFVVLPAPAEVHLAAWLAERGEVAGALFVSRSRSNAGERLSGRSLRRIWLGRKRLAGIAGAGKTVHSLRHSAITAAIRAGGEPMAVQAMARHKSFDTTLGYYHELSRTERPAEDLIRYGGEGETGQQLLPGV